jgi:hypothetical protein
MPQAVSLIAIRISQGNLVQALPHLLAPRMADFPCLPLLRQKGREPLAQPQALIPLAQSHSPTLTRELRRIKTDGDRYGRMEV